MILGIAASSWPQYSGRHMCLNHAWVNLHVLHFNPLILEYTEFLNNLKRLKVLARMIAKSKAYEYIFYFALKLQDSFILWYRFFWLHLKCESQVITEHAWLCLVLRNVEKYSTTWRMRYVYMEYVYILKYATTYSFTKWPLSFKEIILGDYSNSWRVLV